MKKNEDLIRILNSILILFYVLMLEWGVSFFRQVPIRIGFTCCNKTQFSHCKRSQPHICDQTVQIKTVIKSLETISATHYNRTVLNCYSVLL